MLGSRLQTSGQGAANALIFRKDPAEVIFRFQSGLLSLSPFIKGRLNLAKNVKRKAQNKSLNSF